VTPRRSSVWPILFCFGLFSVKTAASLASTSWRDMLHHRMSPLFEGIWACFVANLCMSARERGTRYDLQPLEGGRYEPQMFMGGSHMFFTICLFHDCSLVRTETGTGPDFTSLVSRSEFCISGSLNLLSVRELSFGSSVRSLFVGFHRGDLWQKFSQGRENSTPSGQEERAHCVHTWNLVGQTCASSFSASRGNWRCLVAQFACVGMKSWERGGARRRARISPCEASEAAGLSHGWVNLCTDFMVACRSGPRRCGRARLMQAVVSGACRCEGFGRGMFLRGCLRSQQPLHRIR